MENPILALKEIIKDPIELASITFPSGGIVVLLFAYKQHIHPALADLPDPLSGNIYGALLFLVITLVVSLTLKRVSHDLLNLMYDRLYRDHKRKIDDTWYKRVQEAALSTNDPLLNKYQEAIESLRTNKNPVVAQVDLLQIQSKLARSMSLIFFLFAAILAVKFNVVLVLVCVALSVLMLYAFFKGRWEASELVYKAWLQERNKSSRVLWRLLGF